MTCRIEPFAAHHRNSLVEMILAIQQDEFDLPVTYGQQTDLHDIAAAYRVGVGQFWVAQAPGGPPDHVAGSIGLHDMGTDKRGKRIAALRKLYVREANRGGGGDGVAARLLDALETHARRHGIAELFLGAAEQFAAARRFFERNGFVPIEAERLPLVFVRLAIDTRFYWKQL